MGSAMPMAVTKAEPTCADATAGWPPTRKRLSGDGDGDTHETTEAPDGPPPDAAPPVAGQECSLVRPGADILNIEPDDVALGRVATSISGLMQGNASSAPALVYALFDYFEEDDIATLPPREFARRLARKASDVLTLLFSYAGGPVGLASPRHVRMRPHDEPAPAAPGSRAVDVVMGTCLATKAWTVGTAYVLDTLVVPHATGPRGDRRHALWTTAMTAVVVAKAVGGFDASASPMAFWAARHALSAWAMHRARARAYAGPVAAAWLGVAVVCSHAA